MAASAYASPPDGVADESVGGDDHRDDPGQVAAHVQLDPPHSPSRPPEARSTTIANTSVHAHGLRHTRAAELAHEGKPMNLIQAQLGHASLAVTSTYLAHIAPAQLIEAMRTRPAFSV